MIVVYVIAATIVAIFIAVLMACMQISGELSREEEKRSMCDNNCYDCDAWDWCFMSDQKEDKHGK
jgi:hypothetical protein